ncbi:MAG: two-partner secretion domain-containing protein, partial [Leptospirales bacterium]
MKRSLKLYSLSHKALASFLSVAVVFSTAFPEAALALPRGGVVAKGSASLTYSTNALRIGQSTSSASFNWTSYNVKSGQSVVYSVPTTQSVSLNFIGGTTPSTISGSVKSNGILEFMNANGLIFGSGSTVSAAGVMAFGEATPWGTPTGAVSNAGVLTATNNGTVALVGTSVTNSGTISAPGGEVILAAGSTVTPVSATRSSSLSVATTGGGSIDDSGIIATETVGSKTGTILLQSGMNSGTTTLEPTAVLDASAPNGGNGGSITVNGHTVVLDETAPLDVSAPSGTPGTIVIDPTVTDVGTASALAAIDANQSNYLNSSSVCIVLTANINMADGTLPNGINLYNWIPLGNASSSSNYFTGTFNGNGHTVSGYTIGTSTSNYSGNDVGFIGYLGSGGKVENLGVEGTIYASGSCVGGVVGSNIHGTVEYSYNTGAVNATLGSVGGVAGYNCGTVMYSYNTGAVKAAGCGVGGVVGLNVGPVEYSYNTGAVTGTAPVLGVTGSATKVGGVVGANCHGVVNFSYNTGT